MLHSETTPVSTSEQFIADPCEPDWTGFAPLEDAGPCLNHPAHFQLI